MKSCVEALMHIYKFFASHFFLDLQANNLVFHTAVEHFRKCVTSSEGNAYIQQNGRGSLPHIITSNVEHDSIKVTAEYLLKDGKAG